MASSSDSGSKVGTKRKQRPRETEDFKGLSLAEEVVHARFLFIDVMSSKRMAWLCNTQGSNYLFVLACTTHILEQLGVLDLKSHVRELQGFVCQYKERFGWDRRLALLDTLFPVLSSRDATAAQQKPQLLLPDGPMQTLHDFFEYWAHSVQYPSSTPSTASLIDAMLHKATKLEIDCTVRCSARGFISEKAEQALYFCTHIIYFATVYGTKPLDKDSNPLMQELALRLQRFFHLVQEPNKEVKMELAACVILCRMPDPAVRQWVQSLKDAFMYTKGGLFKFERSTFTMYRLHSHTVYLNLRAVALQEEGSSRGMPQ